MVNGGTTCVMAMANNYGLTIQSMRATGIKIKQTDLASSFMLMGIFMKVNGKKIRPMEKVLTLMQMVRDILEIGKMTSNMGLELKVGLMEQFTKECIMRGKRMERGSYISLTAQFMMASSK